MEPETKTGHHLFPTKCYVDVVNEQIQRSSLKVSFIVFDCLIVSLYHLILTHHASDQINQGKPTQKKCRANPVRIILSEDYLDPIHRINQQSISTEYMEI